jgi:hypothetical protein
MEYRTLPLSCECGRVPKSISAVGLSATHDLVIHWQCPRCHKGVCVVKPLSDCWRECFTEATATTPTTNSNLTVDTPDDRRFLQSVGISCSEYADVPFSLDALASKLRDVLMHRPQIVR